MDTNIIQGSGTASGTDTYTVNLSVKVSALVKNALYIIKFTNANTSASTLNVNSVGVKPIKDKDGNALTSGQIGAGTNHLLVYDGTNFIALTISAASSAPTEQVIQLIPEVAGGVFKGDGTSNDVDITATNDATEQENYYNFTPDAGSSGNQDMSLYIGIIVPLDFGSFKAARIKIKVWADESPVPANTITMELIDTAKVSDGVADVSPTTASTWEEKTYAPDPAGTYTKGGLFIVKITATISQLKNVRVGRIKLDYNIA